MREVRRFGLVFFVFLLAVFSKIPDLCGLEKDTHALLNREIVQSYSILPEVLDNQLGLKRGIMEGLAGKTVLQWFEEAGRQEDEPAYSRSFNHFHDPLQPWYLAGFDETYKSSLIWAQDQGMIGSLFGGNWSWKKARQSFHKGLTSITKTDREKNLADTFRALGQIMHLIQDASVPAHTRNDPHVYIDLFGKKIGKYHYEVWVNDNRRTINLSPKSFDKAIFNIIPEATAPIPIANIFDTNKYSTDGSNPEVATGSSIGIAEYTNANFFSEGTVFKNYPHPDYADTNFQSIDWKNPEVVDAEDGKLDNRIYIKKVVGEPVQRLASLSYISYDCIKKGYYRFSPLVLDHKVYEEYASKLIPRAVGYSAGLIDYFFRGRLQVTAVPIFYKNNILYLRVKIRNMTPDETLTEGTFTLSYSYRPTGGNPDGSQDIWGQSSVVPSGTLLYDGEEKVIDFSLPTPIPRENYDSAKFTLAFRGKLGIEEGAVIDKALTLGEIKFAEEWDNGFAGSHNWAHTDFNLFDQNLGNGSTSNVIEGDTLIKDNIRFAGHQTARVNESFLDYGYNNGQFRDILPILITPDTYLQFKIDAMSINEIPPAPSGYTSHWQALILHFSNGLTLQYFQEGQGLYTGPETAYLTFPMGLIILDNIYEVFKGLGITIPEPLYLLSIDFLQQLFQLEQDSTVQHHQHMEVDSIRIIEGRPQ
ncbi:MAG: hypothetical protein ACUVWO_01310 [Thermodesulfobacteriota bacterium]